MALKLLEILEQFMNDSFLIKLTQFEKTGSIVKNLIPLGNLKIKIQLKFDNVFHGLNFLAVSYWSFPSF